MSNKFVVEVKRIIGVDSASFAYVEAPLEESLLLLGKGNYGKTSLINAVRFFFLPELSLNKCTQKFAFKNGKSYPDIEYYSKDEVADYYFPSQNSCLILEVEHKLIGGGSRRHCQLITLGINYKINRFFIPAPYEDIEHLFWDKSYAVSGARSSVAPGQNLLKSLKKINNSATLIRQQEELDKALYKIDILHPDLCQYAIYPLNEIKPSTVDSLRALIKLLFNKDGNALRIMTSTAIDIQDSSSGALEVDIKDLIAQQEQLAKDREELLKLKEAMPLFAKVRKDFQIQKAQQTHEREYAQVITNVLAIKTTSEGNHGQLVEKIKPLYASLESLSDSKNKLEQAKQDKLTEKGRAIRGLKKNQIVLEKCQKVCDPYGDEPMTEIQGSLKEHIEIQYRELKLQTDSSQRDLRISELPELIENAKREVGKVKERVKHIQFTIREQLPKKNLKVLEAINSSLLTANPHRKLTESELAAIQQFIDLFSVESNQVNFFDETFEYFVKHSSLSLQDQLTNAETEHSALVKELKDLSGINGSSVLHDATKVTKLEKEISKTKNDLETLAEFDYSLRRTREITAELVEFEQFFMSIEKEVINNELGRKKAEEKFNLMDGKLQTAREQCEKINALLPRIEIHKSRFPRVASLVEKIAPDSSLNFNLLPTDTKLQGFETKLEESKGARENVIMQLKSFCLTGLLNDEYGLLKEVRTQQAVSSSFDSLSAKFETLEQSTEQLEKDTQLHNSYIRNRLDRLDKTKTQIDETILRINDELSGVKVNDLSGIKLKVLINGTFDDLVSSWREFDDLETDSTLPANWYKRLQDFLQSDAVNGLDGKLRMENLIKQASYFTKKDNEPWEDKGQSTSTQMLINMHFSEIFVKRLCDDTSKVNFPMMMDEVGQISVEQFPPLIADLKSKGHSLIGATTHGKSADLINAFTNFLVMDEMTSAKPYYQGRSKVCFSPKLEFLVSKQIQQELEVN